MVEYAFKIKILSELPPARSGLVQTLNSLKFKDSLLRNSVSDEIKTAESIAIFKQKMKSCNGAHCMCNICRK